MDSYVERFSKFSSDPISLLNGNSVGSNEFITISANIYSIIKLNDNEKDDPSLAQFYTDGMDVEQIWQQIELYNSSRSDLFRDLAVVCKQSINNNQHENIPSPVESTKEKVDISDDASVDSYESENEDNKMDIDNHDSDRSPNEHFENTAVDDKFFSLRQMEKFLDDEENKINTNDDEGIDYFGDIQSEDDSDNGISDINDDDDDQSEEDLTLDHDEALLSEQENEDNSDKQSARQMKYEDFFSNKKVDDENIESHKEQLSDNAENISNVSNHKLLKPIKDLEDQAVADVGWQMKGETTGDKRPVNSLLQEVLSFDQVERQAPDITDEHTLSLEDTIRQRIKDQAFDDVIRKIKDTRDPLSFKKTVVLNSEKSQMSLHEIYEKEYLKNLNKDVEDKENPAHTELKSLMHNIFQKLDALSNFHFKTAPPDPEIKIISNLPALNTEDVQPVTHSDAKTLAPEEVLEKKDLKSKDEMTAEDRKRNRRKKKLRMKVRAQNREKKLEALADSNEKLQTLHAFNQLKKSAKLRGSRTTLVQNGKSESKISSSKSFFKQLQETKPTNKKSLERKPVARKP